MECPPLDATGTVLVYRVDTTGDCVPRLHGHDKMADMSKRFRIILLQVRYKIHFVFIYSIFS
jgi:hypothetical protein